MVGIPILVPKTKTAKGMGWTTIRKKSSRWLPVTVKACCVSSGDINGALATGERVWKLPSQTDFQMGRQNKSRNSGLLYHSFGNFGEGLGIWMWSSHELQLWTEHIGDSYCMGNSYFQKFLPWNQPMAKVMFMIWKAGWRRRRTSLKNLFQKSW